MGGEVPVRQEAQLFLGTEASSPAEVVKSLSPLSSEGLNGSFLPEIKHDEFTKTGPEWPYPF